MKKQLIFLYSFCFLFSAQVFATHFQGGELFVRNISGNNYEISFSFYTPTVSNPQVNIQSIGCSNIWLTLNEVKTDTLLPCAGTSTIKKIVYKAQTIIPPCLDYKFEVNFCCPPAIMVNSNGSNVVVFKTYGALDSLNHFPVFNSPIPTELFLVEDNGFDCSASDADGDSLVYSFVDDPVISYKLNYGPSAQFGFNAPFSLDSNSGHFYVKPFTSGFFFIGTNVKEYRNGILKSSTNRTWVTNIVQRSNSMPDLIGTNSSWSKNISVCEGDSIQWHSSIRDTGTTSPAIVTIVKDSLSTFLFQQGTNVSLFSYAFPGSARAKPYSIWVELDDGSCGTQLEQFTVKINACTSTNLSDEIALKEEISLFPNPSKGQFHLNSDGSEIFGLELFSLGGQRLMSFSSFQDNEPIDFGHLKNGVYLIKVNTSKGSIFKKVVIAKD